MRTVILIVACVESLLLTAAMAGVYVGLAVGQADASALQLSGLHAVVLAHVTALHRVLK